MLPLLASSVLLAAGALAQSGAASQPPPPPQVAASDPASGRGSVSPSATFLLGNDRFHDDPTLLWEGFLKGMRGFEHFYNPVGNPLYFETPFINTSARFLYLRHAFDENSQLRGGDLNAFALQARIALTDRIAFIATKDGYSLLDAGALPESEGFNDLAFGFKYAFWVDKSEDFVATLGLRYNVELGARRILQGGVGEFSPLLSVAKGWDQFHIIAGFNPRIPVDSDEGNNIIQWDLHFDYEILPQDLPGFAPIFEVHGLHYLDNGTRTPLSVGGADYTNLGSTDVDGSTVVWGGFGGRWKLTPNFSVGATYEIPFTNRRADIFGDRVTFDIEFTW